ncbi:EF-P 5-aminopentanol modification-associated protein YfmH [Ligilactobacillus pobuzihii]|uniref:M16 family peptidase n=1 Tax=Ligilactobacillus pobuzihii TaxID=449659 RepID=A0A0R2L3G1_9LACO|nr:pitrilysin family protein [Ligilactobacillus pobuzihii]KRK10062.1 M16 family peptidase [Ligilactobacillus pobuzihii E100301 = KCTC 13174]KRN96287.1 M16 family peptidase [Ligilactobacillus pobuzihii]GEN48483.1 peptidase M16 [Ligilactobacillus pobuzihii]
MLQKYTYPQFKEVLYRTTLANGLTVNLLPRPDFHKTYAVMTTNYGSIDTKFTDSQEKQVDVPAGTAHFLEHKLFEKEDHDAFDVFGKYGADVNAFTSFTKTSFLFSTTGNLTKCLEFLLDFVQEPYFSSETVEKEKGIIGEEISMYDDDPDWQLFFGMLGNLYPHDPLSVDIAGTKETIAQIDSEILYACYNEFYQPANMDLFVVGGFNLADVLETIETNQANKQFIERSSMVDTTTFLGDSGDNILPFVEKKMAVMRPKSMIGIKGMEPVPAKRTSLKYKIELELGLYLLFGESSILFQELYQKGIVDDSFNYELSVERGFHFVVISGDTTYYEKMEHEIFSTIKNAEQILANSKREFELAKKEFLGQYIQAQNSLESIANGYEGRLFEHATLFDYAEQIQKISLSDVTDTVALFLKPGVISTSRILPIT